jgi:hypothetical protein
VYHKPVNTIRQQLVHPKDPTPIANKCGVIYKIKCANCEHNYIGETARTLGTRVKEHLNTKKDSLSAVGEHCKDTGHSVSWTNISVVGREEHWYRRKIMEAIEISEGAPSLNIDVDVELPAIYTSFFSRDVCQLTSRYKVLPPVTSEEGSEMESKPHA